MFFVFLLWYIEFEYSDKVNDDYLVVIVVICRGILYVKDYYGQLVEFRWVF